MKPLADFLWTIVRWSLPLTVAGVIAAGAIGSGRFGDVVRGRIEERLRQEFPDVAVRVQSAGIVEGEGLVARGVSIVDARLPPQYRQLVWIDELKLACSTDLAALAAGPPQITAVRIRRPTVHAWRAGDGRWSLAPLVRRPRGAAAVPVTVEDATLLLEDAGLRSRATLRQIALAIDPPVAGTADAAVVRGTCSGDLFDQAAFEGRLAPASGAFDVTGTVGALDLSKRLTATLPLPALAGRWLTGLEGRLDVRWRAAGSLAALDATVFEATGRLEAGRFAHPQLPFAVSDVTAEFGVDRPGLRCDRLEARAGSTLLRGSGRLGGWDEAADFDLAVEAERLVVGRHWEGLLPAALTDHWSRLLPAGEVDVTARVARRGGAIEPDIAVRCRNVSLTYYRFPYRLDRTVGTVTYKDGGLALHLTGQAGGHPVQVDGQLARAEGGTAGFVEVKGDRMQIDDALLAAMPPRSAEIVRTLRGAGTFGFVFRHERAPHLPGGHANSLGIRLMQCSLCYAGFPYPLANVSGFIRMHRGRWTIQDVTGSNDTGVIRCSGALDPLGPDDGELTLNLAGNGVVLEPELRDALPPGMRRIWNDLDPRGNAEFTATVRHRVKARRTDVRLAATPVGDTVSIEPSWFPYRLERLQGRLALEDGRLRFENVRGVHDRTTVAAEGTCQFAADGGWRVSFERLAADRFRADHEVLQALPAGLRRAVSSVGLEGLLSLSGAVDIYSTAAVPVVLPDGRTDLVPGPAAAAWDVGVDLEQASLDLGLPVEHVHGGIRLRGQSDGRGWQTTGDLAIDSAICRGVQLASLQGPVAMDSGGVRFGTAATAAGRPGSRRLSARVAGGTLLLDGAVAADGPGGFTLAATLGDADLERIAGEITGAANRYRGRVFGGVEVTGSRAGRHSLAGRGQLRLRDADIYELSVIVALLKILRVKAPDRNAFSTSLVDFRSEGPRAYLDTIELSGDAISLVGNGEIDFDSNIKLTFRPIMGDSERQLPAMKRLLGGAGGQFMLVHVDGTLANPEPTTEAFPTLAAALQKFQAPRRGGGGERAAALWEPAR
ncbi:MAG: hypothetical protein ACKONH_12600 [Planctomycetia bacterium]